MDYKIALLRIGVALGRARGPYGRSISPRDEHTLLLVAELLDMRQTPPVAEDVPGLTSPSSATRAPG